MDVKHRFKPETKMTAEVIAAARAKFDWECHAASGDPPPPTHSQGGEVISTQVSPEPACGGHDGG